MCTVCGLNAQSLSGSDSSIFCMRILENKWSENMNLKQKISDVIKYKLPAPLSYKIKKIYRGAFNSDNENQWGRIVMNSETEKHILSLDYKSFKALEISGDRWSQFGFAEYSNVYYPDYDICSKALDNTFDIIIAEQVLEHVLFPYRAVKNLYTMLNLGGLAVITTPFLLKIHGAPLDCSRWTELGLSQLLIEGGFEKSKIKTGSWGNESCVVANFKEWVKYDSSAHSLDNDPEFPLVVWAFAYK